MSGVLPTTMTPILVAKRASLRKLTNLISPVPADIDVAQAAAVVPIKTIAAACGLGEDDYEPYGHFKAKISEKVGPKLRATRGRGFYVVVAGINPTPLGEGKSTTTIGLAQAMGAHLDKECVACIRQPSMGAYQIRRHAFADCPPVSTHADTFFYPHRAHVRHQRRRRGWRVFASHPEIGRAHV